MRRSAAIAAIVAMALTGCAGAVRQTNGGGDDAGGVINGQLLSTRTETGRYWFEWGTTAQLGKRTPDTPIDFVAGQVKVVNQTLRHLDPETTYYWRVCADDQDPDYPEPGCSDLGHFTTDPAPPGEAVEVGQGWRFFANVYDRGLNLQGPYTFNGPAVLTVLDLYCPGDRYRVLDNGVAIGTTGRVPDDGSCDPYIQFPNMDEAFANPKFSRGSFPLGSGPHSLRIRVLTGQGGAGGAAVFRLDPFEP